ncbi:tetratricopeptide repeat protein [Cytophaga aurantiaca]|uniref:tetratricopeptide repeat protein n=1 Tax=Cytophaga aurantiaca TaxID=29530 RepID=UPI0003768FF7|nr:tetratricopeptide repeat protein [Cytophaga aurantiaca]
MTRYLFLFITCLASLSCFSQDDEEMLLSNNSIQLEATDAINNMYNFKFDKAEEYFSYLQTQYPEHPMPYFLMGLSNFWKMMPYNDTKPFEDTYEKEFLKYIDLSIEKGEALFDEDDKNIEAAFFLCAAHGFKGRYFAEHNGYVKAAFQGKSALHYLTYTKGKGDMSPEFLFGEGIFNYYAEWMKEEYPLLKPLIGMFPKGSKSVGLSQLTECANSAFYTRIEAQYFLMRIYNNEENKPRAAYPYAKHLNETFPDNPYFQRVYARAAWDMGHYAECEKICYDINYKVNIAMPGYEENTGRYASYFLGRILYEKGELEKSKFYLLKTSVFAESGDMAKMGYSLSAYYYLGLIETRLVNHSEAEKYFLKVIKLGEDKGDNAAVYSYSLASCQLGILYEKLGYTDRAKAYYKNALQRVKKLDEKTYSATINEVTRNCNEGIERMRKAKK